MINIFDIIYMGQLIAKHKKKKTQSSPLMFIDDDYYKIIHIHSEINKSISNLLVTPKPESTNYQEES